VTKNWIVNDIPYANGAQPGGLSAQLQLTGPGGSAKTDQGWGVVRTGYKVGDTTSLSEEVALIDPATCTSTATVTSVNGVAANTQLGAGFDFALTQVHN